MTTAKLAAVCLPAQSVIKEVCVEVLPSGDEADGDQEEGDGEDEQNGTDNDRPRFVAQFEAARTNYRPHRLSV